MARTQRRWDDSPGLALAKAMADDRHGSPANMGGFAAAIVGLVWVVVGLGRGLRWAVRSLVRRLREPRPA